MVVAALVLGILATALNLIIGCIPIIGQIICMVLGALAIVLAVLGRKKTPEKKGMAIAALVLGIVGTAWALIALIFCGAALAAGAGEAGKLLDILKSQ